MLTDPSRKIVKEMKKIKQMIIAFAYTHRCDTVLCSTCLPSNNLFNGMTVCVCMQRKCLKYFSTNKTNNPHPKKIKINI